MKLDSMSDLYLCELRDMYNGEKQLVKALPKMAKAASTEELRAAIEDHLQQTENHVSRLETIFKSLDEKPGGETCEAMQGLIAEGQEVLKADGEDAVRDAALIMAAQKVEHYEMATYGALREYAHLLNREQDADLLQQTLDEEKLADRKLNEIAEQVVNKRALV
jgi:ferritin-like metal-binding protein YciE